MDWLNSRYNTAIEALTAKRTLLVGSIVAACGIAGTWLPQIEWNGRQMFDIPTWTWWAVVALAALLGITFEYAHRTRTVLVPKIKTSFDQNDSGVVHTPAKFKDKDGQTISETMIAYVRIKVEASSALGVKECSAFLTGIEKRNKEGRFVPISLPNSILLTDPVIYVPARVPRTIDFLASSATNNQLGLTGAMPLTLRNAFDDHTTYRFKIAVIAEHATSEIYVDVIWAGKWDAITAMQYFPRNKKVS